ncbi:ABC transporter permease [Microbacterium sp. H83]|uniref:ABC transporter permease n=1 Tax=Microbacterium sp. H83 TaxID=1827324 RepID=UPI0007F53765|nr:ABC transporter permease [Microbacterium sp. H83]OAN33609.1 peptide ABC transporter permease [Microbacterium sp. H83]
MSDPRTPTHFVAPVETESIAVDAVRISDKPSNLWRDAWADLRRRPLFWFSVVLATLFIVMALFPTLFTQTSPSRGCDLMFSNEGPTEGHPFGFTFQGCDIYARVIWGAQTSLAVGLIATGLSAILGLIMGALAGFYGGWLDAVLSRVGDIFFAIPYILAAVVVMTVLHDYRSVWTLALAIGGFSWASTARVVRAEVLRVRQADFIMASRSLGQSKFRTLLSHVIPNAIAPLLVVSTLGLAAAIVAEATLTFLGVGLGGDVMSWGNDISKAQASLRVAPMALIYPSIALTLAVLSFVTLGELIRDALDPKARARR